LEWIKRRLDSDRAILYSVVAFVIIGGFIYSLILGDKLRFQDEGHYLRMANNLIKNRIYSYDINGVYPTAFHPPGYTLILASSISLGGGFVTLRMLNFICLGISIILLSGILKKYGFPLGAKWVPLMLLYYPVIFFTASTLYPQIIATTLFILTIYLVDRWSLKFWDVFFVGLIYGFLILISPSFILVLPVMFIAPYLLKKNISIRFIIFFLLGISLIMTPWVIRNYMVFNRFVLLSNNAGKTFILGNSENARPNTGEGIDLSRYDNEIKQLNLDEVETDKYYKKKAFEWIRNNPSDFLKLYIMKFFNYFNYRNELATKSQQSSLRDFIVFITYYPLLILALIRLVFIKRYPVRDIELLFMAFYLMSAFANALFLTRIRYRLPYDLLLICLSAISLDYLKIYFKTKTNPEKRLSI